jgi:hypothetical protein
MPIEIFQKNLEIDGVKKIFLTPINYTFIIIMIE